MVKDFAEGLKEFGVQSRVRADHGGKFVHVNKLMSTINREDHVSFITGKSVRNQCIEPCIDHGAMSLLKFPTSFIIFLT